MLASLLASCSWEAQLEYDKTNGPEFKWLRLKVFHAGDKSVGCD